MRGKTREGGLARKKTLVPWVKHLEESFLVAVHCVVVPQVRGLMSDDGVKNEINTN
jgi:hypothetical protein